MEVRTVALFGHPGYSPDRRKVAHEPEAEMLVHIVADYGHGDLAFAEVARIGRKRI